MPSGRADEAWSLIQAAAANQGIYLMRTETEIARMGREFRKRRGWWREGQGLLVFEGGECSAAGCRPRIGDFAIGRRRMAGPARTVSARFRAKLVERRVVYVSVVLHRRWRFGSSQ